MKNSFYFVDDKIIDEKIVIYLRSKREICAIKSQIDIENADQKTLAFYLDLASHIGITEPFIKIKNRVFRSLCIQRCHGRSLISSLLGNEINCSGLTKIPEFEYIKYRKAIIVALGKQPPKVLMHFP